MRWALIVLVLFGCKKPPQLRDREQATADALALTGIKMECYGGPRTIEGGGCDGVDKKSTEAATTCIGKDVVVQCPADSALPCAVLHGTAEKER